MQIHVGRTRGLEIMGADDWRKREGLDRIYVTKGTAYPADSKSSRRRQALLHSRLGSWVIGDCRIEGLRRMGSLAHHTRRVGIEGVGEKVARPPFGSMADTHPGVRDLVQLDASPRGDVLHGKQILSSQGSIIIQKDGLGGGAATASGPTVEEPTPRLPRPRSTGTRAGPLGWD
jgi:hypothetical protein